MKTRIGIFGYGNLGKGVEDAVLHASDLELVKVFSRRSGLKTVHGEKIENVKNISKYRDDIDVLILCGGSATDLPEQTYQMVREFNVVDSFDTHANIPTHFAKVNEEAKKNNKVGVISVGWDPGLFSVTRVLFESFLETGSSYTFWGTGVSQGHSDAIRRVPGVKKGIQYTVPVPAALEAVRNCENPVLSTREKHTRVCYVVADKGADKAAIEKEIKEMKNYFDQYDTTVNFISDAEFDRDHTAMPHGGFVLRSGSTHDGAYKYLLELSIKLDSNPGFTGTVLAAYARAAHRMALTNTYGCFTAFDIPVGMLSPMSRDQLRATSL